MSPPSSKRSHAPSLLRSAERAILDEQLFSRGETVLAACSGGPDSVALMHVLARLRGTIGHALVAHGVDHGLRPEAPRELAAAAELAASIEVPFSVTRVEVAHGSNLEARARDARLKALAEAAERAGAVAIATGHTADDRAETFLLRLLRGAGPRGLAVLPPSAPLPSHPSIRLVRPLIHARRAAVIAHVERHFLPVARDPMNDDPRFSRTRVRNELLPLMATMAPRVVEHLASLADMLEATPPSPLDGMGRAQRIAIERAKALGLPRVVVRLRGGREVEATFPDGRIVLTER